MSQQKTILDTVKENLAKRESTARKWFLSKMQSFKPSANQLMVENDAAAVTQTIYGNMYMFKYEPKLQDDLPYYDRFPLVFLVEMYPDGSFLGINFHYLPLRWRDILLRQLLTLKSTTKIGDDTRLRLSWDVLKSTTKLSPARASIKKYLPNHIKSKIIKINPDDWRIAIHLPVENFKKAPKQTVWLETRSKF